MPTLEILRRGKPITQASQAFILLHGRGGTARDILGLAEALCDDQFYIVAPQAPHHVWYPQSFLAEERCNEPYLSASVTGIKNLIDETAKHIPKERMYIMGFSQGACMALEVAARFATKYAAVIAFTGALIGSNIDERKYKGNFEGTKIFMSNGDHDPHVPLERSEQSKKVLEKLGADVTLKVYEGRSHTITDDEINWVKQNIMNHYPSIE